jgi:predicted MPP superfamily phosphohydrolase
MRPGFIIVLLVVILLLLLLDWYVYQGIKSLTTPVQNNLLKQGIRWAHWIISIGLPVFMVLVFLNMGRMNPYFTTAGSLFTTMVVTKLFFVAILMGEDLWRVGEGGFKLLSGNSGEGFSFMPERRRFVSQVALGIAAIPFTSFLYGMTRGKHNYKVHRHTLYFKDLPPAFEGFTITQISDIHSGSFEDEAAVRRGIEMINQQDSDLFVFTGDLVNSVASEFDRWADIFGQIRAPYGKFSILGNHDYGDYHFWPSEQAKADNFRALKEQHSATGFRLLLDEHVAIEKDGQRLSLLGVENWGLGFGQRGDLKKALQNVASDDFKILLSHDPTHWDHEVKSRDEHIHLTLSGHTHGMQVGVELPGFRWSPVKYRYPKWAGLYEENDRFLYINRGFGYLGFHGRVGIWPEITVLELRSALA